MKTLGILLLSIVLVGLAPRREPILSTVYYSAPEPELAIELQEGRAIPDFSANAIDNYLTPQPLCSFDASSRVTPLMSRGLNVQAFEERLDSLPMRGAGFCARGVRKSLNVLFGKGPAGGPNAKDYDENFLKNWRTQDSCFKKVESPTFPKVQDFDIRVLQPGPRSSKYGHIEIFYKGRWYSDFEQRTSLFDSGKYRSVATYRLSFCNRVTQALQKATSLVSEILQLDRIVPSAVAREKGDEPSPDSIPVPSRELGAVSVRDGKTLWRIVDRTIDQGEEYVLQKWIGKSKKEIAIDSNSAFLLVESQKKLLGSAAQKLVDAYVQNWIRSEGKSSVQEIVLQQDALTTHQREAYLKQGLKLPADYSLVSK